MFLSVFDIIREYPSATLLFRHGEHAVDHIIARYASEGFDPNGSAIGMAYSGKLSRQIPASMFPLTMKGIQTSFDQGVRLAREGVNIQMVVTSTLGHGPQTGYHLIEGVKSVTGMSTPMDCHDFLDFPVYSSTSYQKGVSEHGPVILMRWLRGDPEWTNLTFGTFTSQAYWQDRPEILRAMMREFCRQGTLLLVSHTEIVTLAHQDFVVKRPLSKLDENWSPENNSGVVLWLDNNGDIIGLDFDPDFNIVQ